MKNVKLVFASAALLICFLVGCQKTPDAPFVIAKNEQNMLEKARQSNDANDESFLDDNISKNEVAKQFEEESPYVTSFSGNSDMPFTVNVNADLDIPNVSKMPIVELYASEFSEELVQKIFDITCANVDMYPSSDLKTQSFLEKDIIRIQQKISEGLDTDGNMQRELELLQAEYENAPEKTGAPISQIGFSERENDFFTFKEFQAKSTSLRNSGLIFAASTSWIAKNDEERSRTNSSLMFVNFDLMPDVAFSMIEDVTGRDDLRENIDLDFTPIEAEHLALEFCQGAGISDMEINRVMLVRNRLPNAQYAYQVEFSRIISDIAISSPVLASYAGDIGSSDEWLYEQFCIVLNNKGVVYLDWKAPIRIGNMLVESCKLIPFDEISSIFERMIRVKYEPVINIADYDSLELSISRVQLCMQRIAKKDSITVGLLVPTWNFYGTGIYTRGGESFPYNSTSEVSLLLSMNAVDGTIIDPQKGY
ncbi:MAG: DUF6034 family protein [Christensenellaceae bacterium]